MTLPGIRHMLRKGRSTKITTLTDRIFNALVVVEISIVFSTVNGLSMIISVTILIRATYEALQASCLFCGVWEEELAKENKPLVNRHLLKRHKPSKIVNNNKEICLEIIFDESRHDYFILFLRFNNFSICTKLYCIEFRV